MVNCAVSLKLDIYLLNTKARTGLKVNWRAVKPGDTHLADSLLNCAPFGTAKNCYAYYSLLTLSC
jgi:hypothetical protein